jgi:hypothetical protein
MAKCIYTPNIADTGILNAKFGEYASKNPDVLASSADYVGKPLMLISSDDDGCIMLELLNDELGLKALFLPSADMVDWKITNDAKMELVYEMSSQMNISDVFFEDVEGYGYNAYGESACNCRVIMGKWLVELTLQDEDHVDHSFTFTDKDLYTAMNQAYAKFQEYVDIHKD